MLKKYTTSLLITALIFSSSLDASQVAVMQKPANIELEAKHWKEHYEQKLLQAAGDGSLAILENLVERDDIDINVQDEKGDTALMLALRNYHCAAAEKLIEKGADFALKNKAGTTAFLIAALRGRFSVAEKLMDLGADVNATTLEGNTALMYTVWSSHRDQRNFFIKLLARANNLYHKNNDGAEIFRNVASTLDACLREAFKDYEKRRTAYAKTAVAPIIEENITELYPVLVLIVADYYTEGGLPAEEKKEEEKHPSQEK